MAEKMKDAVLESEMTWSNIDYLEASRYVVLNCSKKECHKSRLRKILLRRRGTRVTHPGIKGPGPRGKTRGDQEQWIFDLNMTLTDENKEELIASVVGIVMEHLFKLHYYSFGERSTTGWWANWPQRDLCIS